MFTINSAQCDWYTLTSFSPRVGEYIQATNSGLATWSECKVRGYEGVKRDYGEGNGNLFILTGEQKNKPHYMVQGTGRGAQVTIDNAIIAMKEHVAKLTRLDIQFTVKQPKGTKWRGSWLWKHFPQTATVVGSGGDVTLYPSGFGCTSDTTWRIYIKRDNREVKYLRFEVMLRGKHAVAAGNMLKNGATFPEIYKPLFMRLLAIHECLGKMPEAKKVVKLMTQEARPLVIQSAERDTAAWIKKVAIPATWRYINCHDSPQEEVEDIYIMLENLLWGTMPEEEDSQKLVKLKRGHSLTAEGGN